MEKSFYKSPKPSFIMKQLWSACGADSYVLERSTYTDHVKYACLGGIVLATGFMAAMAGGYAFYVIFGPTGEGAVDIPIDYMAVLTSIIFGCIWGLIIFNIDRFIVASTGKGDGTEAITFDEIKAAIPRILMGIIIAFTISKPVELKMFSTEIGVELKSRQLAKEADFIKDINDKFQPRISERQDEIYEIEAVLKEKELLKQQAELNFTAELDESGGTGNRGYGPVAREKDTIRQVEKREYLALVKEMKPRIEELRMEIKEQKNEKTVELNKKKAISNDLNGLSERIDIVHEIVDWKLTLFITLLFMTIELTPIFFKMMLIKSPYDFMNDNLKALIQAEHGIEVQYDFYKDKDGLQRDLVVHHQSEKLIKEKIKLIQTQSELSDFIIDKWKGEEMKKIEKNPDDYIDKA
jgi:hypothetical protein